MGIGFALEIIGTIAFAISGACVAIEKNMDMFGVATLGMTTAVGGGILRDLILGKTPPFAFQKPVYALLSIFVSLIVFFPQIRKYASDLNKPIYIIIDSLGLAMFTVMGVRTGIQYHGEFLSVFVGVVTGVGGGVIRDLFAGNRPYIFVKHFYATASLIGAILTVLCWPLGGNVAMVLGAVTIMVLRFFAARYKWSLPRPHSVDDDNREE